MQQTQPRFKVVYADTDSENESNSHSAQPSKHKPNAKQKSQRQTKSKQVDAIETSSTRARASSSPANIAKSSSSSTQSTSKRKSAPISHASKAPNAPSSILSSEKKSRRKRVSAVFVRETLRSWPIPRETIAQIDGSDSEDFCFACRLRGSWKESDGELLPCSGVCAHSWHIACLNLTQPPQQKHWFCDRCFEGQWPLMAPASDSEEEDANMEEGISTRTILMAAIKIHEKKGRHAWIKHLCQLSSVKQSIRTNAIDEVGFTSLHHAVIEFLPAHLILRIMELGADVNIEDLAKTTSIHHAFSRQNMPAVLCLLTSPQIDLKLRGCGHVTFAPCANGDIGLGPGKSVQGIKGYFRFQLYVGFAIRFTIQQEFRAHKTITFKKIVMTKKEQDSTVQAAAAAVDDNQSPLDMERHALFQYMEERLNACCSVKILALIYVLLTEGTEAASAFSFDDFQHKYESKVNGSSSNDGEAKPSPIQNDPQAPMQQQQTQPMELDVPIKVESIDEAPSNPADNASIAVIASSPRPGSLRRSTSGSSKKKSNAYLKTLSRVLPKEIIALIVAHSERNAQESQHETLVDIVNNAIDELEEDWIAAFNSSPEFASLERPSAAAAHSSSKKPSSSSSVIDDTASSAVPREFSKPSKIRISASVTPLVPATKVEQKTEDIDDGHEDEQQATNARGQRKRKSMSLSAVRSTPSPSFQSPSPIASLSLQSNKRPKKKFASAAAVATPNLEDEKSIITFSHNPIGSPIVQRTTSPNAMEEDGDDSHDVLDDDDNDDEPQEDDGVSLDIDDAPEASVTGMTPVVEMGSVSLVAAARSRLYSARPIAIPTFLTPSRQRSDLLQSPSSLAPAAGPSPSPVANQTPRSQVDEVEEKQTTVSWDCLLKSVAPFPATADQIIRHLKHLAASPQNGTQEETAHVVLLKNRLDEVMGMIRRINQRIRYISK